MILRKKYNLPIRVVVRTPGSNIDSADDLEEAFTEPGELVNSGQFDGLQGDEALSQIADYIEQEGFGERETNYRLKDWLVSRQRYWGAPIPIVYCEQCGTVPVPEEELPVTLPTDVKFGDSGTLLQNVEDFYQTECPECGGPAHRETDTMDTFVCSSWYFLRFASPDNEEIPFDKEEVDYWLPVDQYTGGVEHAILHLMYAVFHEVPPGFGLCICTGTVQEPSNSGYGS